MELQVRCEQWPLSGEFRISRGARTSAQVVVAELSDGEHRGRGECVPYARYGETVEGVEQTLLGLREPLAAGKLDRTSLQHTLAPGAARNALDCALWDLDARRRGQRVWQLAGLAPPQPVLTAYTLSLDSPANMQAQARAESARPLLKLKLGGEDDLPRVAAVREGAPQSRLIVDANEAWSEAQYAEFAPALAELGVAMIEQPLPAGADEALAELPHPVAVCADESSHDSRSLAEVAARYNMINIKLDKTGGLTEALVLRAAAREAGLAVMVGCMVATSLAMAPAVLLAQGADIVDLDGPLLMRRDRQPGLHYHGASVAPPQAALWG